MTTQLDEIICKLKDSGDHQDSAEVSYYWNLIFEDIEKYANPELDYSSVEDHFYDLLGSLTIAVEQQFFHLGVQYATRFITESLLPFPEKPHAQMKREYKKLFRPVKKKEKVS